ncbi:MAG TPA: iron-containing redox enzyme family protein [Anaeromyxobacteraceae bacterium]|nr:iron-containing redox enzyme family protein [Anaeromyxobacteraceae bacterium]
MDQLVAMRSASLARLKQSSIFQRLAAGDVDRRAYARYLLNVYHYAQHSSQVISLAASRAVRSHPALAAYLMHHATEEVGHEEWACSDLRRLGLTDEEIRSSRPGTACTSMVGMEYFVAGHWNPVALFGWLFVLEALGDDVGHFVAKALQSSLRVEGRATSFLDGHGSADHGHIRDITTAIERHMTAPGDVADMLHIAQVSQDLYLAMLEESLAGSGP